MHCSNCGAEIKEDAKFCTVCGAPQALGESIGEQIIIQQQQEKQGEKLKGNTKGIKFLNKKRWMIFIVITIVLILAFGGVISARFIKEGKIKDNINLGNKYLQEGKYEEAILAFEKTIQIDPKNVEARIQLARTYINLKKYDKAENVLKEAMDIDVKNLKPKQELIKLYILEGKELITAQKYQEGKEYFNKAIELSKEDASIYLEIAENYVSINQLDEAVKILEKGYVVTKDEKIKKKLEELNKKVMENNPSTNNGNIANGGKVYEKENWIYYSGVEKSGLYKIKSDGTNNTKLLDNASVSYINVVNDWIYFKLGDGYSEYQQIYKMKTDGSNKTELYEQKYISNLIVVDGWIYFLSHDNESGSDFGIYRIKTDGTSKTLIDKGSVSSISIVDNYIYYHNDGIYKVKTDGSNKTKLSNISPVFMVVKDKNIYYCPGVYEFNSEYKICKIDLNGGNFKEICKFNSHVTEMISPNFFNVDENWIYYMCLNGTDLNVYKIKTDGTEFTKLADSWCQYINITKDWVYCEKVSEAIGNYSRPTCEKIFYRIKKDGTQKQILNSCILQD